MNLTPAQEQIAADTHRFRILVCGRKFGKTTLASEEIVGASIFQNDKRVMYLAPTLEDARKLMWDRLINKLRPAIVKSNDTRLELKIRTKQGGFSQIYLGSWEKIQNYRGDEFDFIVPDETQDYRNFWTGWQEALRPTLTPRRGSALFMGTPKGFTHLYDLYNTESNDTDFKSFHFTSYDNPFVPVEEIETAKRQLTEDRFAQEYLADFRKTEGLVYKEFVRDKHLFGDEIQIERHELVAGLDFGYVHPAAVIQVTVDAYGNYWVTDEWYKTGRTEDEVADYVVSQKFNRVWPDSENPSAIEVLRRKGVNLREVVKGKDSIKSGIQLVRELFKSNRLKIHKKCINLINELETYSYPDEVNNRELPIKEHDDACFIAGTLIDGIPIEKIGFMTGVKDVYKYKIGDEVLTATPHHKVVTQRGLVRIDALRYDDIIWKNKSLFTTVSDGCGIRKLLNGAIGIIISAVKRCQEASERDYMFIHGKSKMELSRKDTLSIIRMAIPQIILLIIWSVFSLANTLRFMLQKKKGNSLEKISRKQLLKLQNGLKLQLDMNLGLPEGKLMQNICLIAPLLQENVTYAEKNMEHKETVEKDFVTSTAVRKHYVGRVPVYNLRTRSGMYLANGILVSNCDAVRYVLSGLEASKKTQATVFVPRPGGYLNTSPQIGTLKTNTSRVYIPNFKK